MNRPSEMPFPEREELSLIHNSLAAQRNSSGLFLLQGKAGAGKTRVVKALARSMEAGGWKVFPRNIGESFASLAQLLGSLLDELTRAGQAIGSRETDAEFDLVFRQALTTLTDQAPVLLVLDGMDEILLDTAGKRRLFEVAQVVYSSPGSHLVLASRGTVLLGPLTFAIDLLTIPGLTFEAFQSLSSKLGLRLREDQLRFLHQQVDGLPKALELAAESPEAALGRLEKLGPSPELDDVYRELYDLRRSRIFRSLTMAQTRVARAVLGFLAVVREAPSLRDLTGFIKVHSPSFAPEGSEGLWQFLCDSKLTALLDLPSPVERSQPASGALRLAHKSFQDFLLRDFSEQEKGRFHQILADIFHGALTEVAQRNLLFHLLEGWKSSPAELADQLCKVEWPRLMDSWQEGCGFILDDLVKAWKKIRRREDQVARTIEDALSYCLNNSDPKQRLSLLELACRMMCLNLNPPLIRKLAEDIFTTSSDDSLVAIRQDELKGHLRRSSGNWRLRILLDLWPGYYPLFAIEDELNQQGIFLEIVESSKEKLDLLRAKNAELIATTPGCLLGSNGQGIKDLSVLGVLNRSFGADKILIDRASIDLDINGKPENPQQIAEALLIATQSSTSLMFLYWFLAQNGLDPRALRIDECSDYLKGAQRTRDSGRVGVLSTWEPYCSILTTNKRHGDFRVVCDSSTAPLLIIDLLVARRASADYWAKSRELKILGQLYDQALKEKRTTQEVVSERICRRLETDRQTYEIGRRGVRFFNRAQMKPFFRNGGSRLQEIFEAVARAWGKPDQVDCNGTMTDNFRKSVGSLFDTKPVWIWAEPVPTEQVPNRETEPGFKASVHSASLPTVFLSYSHEDKHWKEHLAKHLNVLEREGHFQIWHDRQISTGSEWLRDIEAAMERAHVAVLLISANFLDSNFICKREVPKLLERRDRDGLHLLPVIVSDCSWREVTWLSGLQVRPRNGKPLSQVEPAMLDTELKEIAEEISKLLHQ